MRLIITENGAMLSEVTIGREAVFVGSSPSCKVHLPDSRIAHQQIVVFPSGDGDWILEQLHPENPVHVNGMTVTQRTQLRLGDEISVREFMIRAYPATEEASSAAGAAPEIGTSVAQLEKFAASRLPAGSIIKKPEEPLAIQSAQIQRIGRTNLLLARTDVPEQVMNVALQTLLETFSAQRAWIGIRRVNYGAMEYTEGRFINGKAADLTEIGDNLKPRVLDRNQFILVPRVSADDRTSILAGPLIGPDSTLGMIYIDGGPDTGKRFEIADLDYFMVVANLFAVQLDAVFKQIAKQRQAMVDGEVSVAHEIQARLTPRKLPQWPNLQFGAFREGGREHSGDIYDLLKLKNNHAAFMVAHTRVAGAVPSMLMGQAQAAFRSAVIHMDTPQVFMRCANWMFHDGQPDHPLECFVASIDPESGEMRYSVAGRLGAYIIGQRGDERSLLPAEPLPPLGMDKNASYPALTAQIEPGESLVVFTPGVTTAKNAAGEVFGEDRFVNILCDGFGQLASSMLKEMLTDLRAFTQGGSQPNDVTVLMAHRV